MVCTKGITAVVLVDGKVAPEYSDSGPTSQDMLSDPHVTRYIEAKVDATFSVLVTDGRALLGETDGLDALLEIDGQSTNKHLLRHANRSHEFEYTYDVGNKQIRQYHFANLHTRQYFYGLLQVRS